MKTFPHWSTSERSLSLSDTELSSPELTGCYELHRTEEEADASEEEERMISENGQEVVYPQTVDLLEATNTYSTCSVSCDTKLVC